MVYKKRAVSPVVSTVLLIMMVIIIAIIILLWTRGFIKETILKEVAGESKRVQAYCREVKIDPILNDDGSFGFNNVGNIPVYSINVKLTKDGSSDNVIIEGEEGVVNPGFSIIINSVMLKGRSDVYYDYEEVKIIPILLGKDEEGNAEPFICPETDGIII